MALSFNPANINNETNESAELEELYLLLVEKKVIKANRTVSSKETLTMNIKEKIRELRIGDELQSTFVGNDIYSIYGETFTVYKANLMSNIRIEEIEIEDDGNTKIIYSDKDSRPIFISYTGFNTPDEAKQELETIMRNKHMYEDALTLSEHLQEMNKDF